MLFKSLLLEYKRDITARQYGPQLLTAIKDENTRAIFDMKAENVPIDVLLQFFEDNDPTKNNMYVLWMIKQYLDNNQLLRLEDFGVMKGELALYHKAKPRLPVEERDIGRMDYAQFENVVHKIKTGEDFHDMSVEELKKNPDIDVIIATPQGVLAKPKTEKASCEMGKGTKWCTAATDGWNAYEEYDDNAKQLQDLTGKFADGGLFIYWEYPGKKKYQLWYGYEPEEGQMNVQIMDAQDKPVSKEWITQRIKHPVVGPLFKAYADTMKLDLMHYIKYSEFRDRNSDDYDYDPDDYIDFGDTILNYSKFSGSSLNTGKRWPEMEEAILERLNEMSSERPDANALQLIDVATQYLYYFVQTVNGNFPNWPELNKGIEILVKNLAKEYEEYYAEREDSDVDVDDENARALHSSLYYQINHISSLKGGGPQAKFIHNLYRKYLEPLLDFNMKQVAQAPEDAFTTVGGLYKRDKFGKYQHKGGRRLHQLPDTIDISDSYIFRYLEKFTTDLTRGIRSNSGDPSDRAAGYLRFVNNLASRDENYFDILGDYYSAILLQLRNFERTALPFNTGDARQNEIEIGYSDLMTAKYVGITNPEDKYRDPKNKNITVHNVESEFFDRLSLALAKSPALKDKKDAITRKFLLEIKSVLKNKDDIQAVTERAIHRCVIAADMYASRYGVPKKPKEIMGWRWAQRKNLRTAIAHNEPNIPLESERAGEPTDQAGLLYVSQEVSKLSKEQCKQMINKMNSGLFRPGGKKADDHQYKVLNVVNEYYKERIKQMPKEWQDLLTSESASQLSAKIPDLPLNVEPLTLKSLTVAFDKYIDKLYADEELEYAKEHEKVLKDNPNLIKDWWNSVTNKEYIPWEV